MCHKAQHFMRIRNVETAVKADLNPHLPNAVDALGIFDNIVQPIFPFPMSELSIMLSVEEMTGPSMFEIRLNSPDDELISKGSFGILPDSFGFGRKVINIPNFLVAERGKYTVDIFQLDANQKLTFMKTERLFIADYPVQREFTQAEIDAIIADENLIKLVKTEFKPMEFIQDPNVKPIKLQLSLDKNQPVEEGYIAFPEDDKLTINGKEFDLTGMRRHIEWMFGSPIPKPQGDEEEQPATEQTQNIKTENN